MSVSVNLWQSLSQPAQSDRPNIEQSDSASLTRPKARRHKVRVFFFALIIFTFSSYPL